MLKNFNKDEVIDELPIFRELSTFARKIITQKQIYQMNLEEIEASIKENENLNILQ